MEGGRNSEPGFSANEGVTAKNPSPEAVRKVKGKKKKKKHFWVGEGGQPSFPV